LVALAEYPRLFVHLREMRVAVGTAVFRFADCCYVSERCFSADALRVPAFLLHFLMQPAFQKCPVLRLQFSELNSMIALIVRPCHSSTQFSLALAFRKLQSYFDARAELQGCLS